MQILVKFPTRSRHHKFLQVLNLLNNKAANSDKISYLITVDADDSTMNEEILRSSWLIDNVTVVKGVSSNKIHACNRDMEKVNNWDITLLMSDDMIPQMDGWDDIIREEMSENYPDLDGVLWHHDGYQNRISTLCIMGQKYWSRFNYFYHPDYISLWADNEFTEVAKGLNKLHYSEKCMFKHEHCMNNPSVLNDALYKRNEPYYHVDKNTYEWRKKHGFPK